MMMMAWMIKLINRIPKTGGVQLPMLGAGPSISVKDVVSRLINVFANVAMPVAVTISAGLECVMSRRLFHARPISPVIVVVAQLAAAAKIVGHLVAVALLTLLENAANAYSRAFKVNQPATTISTMM